jgi:REP element-mobilizing transposase RayT
MASRKRLRLAGYDYRKANAYFITISCDKNRRLFGRITNGQMHRNSCGTFAHNQWLALSDAYPHIDLGEFVIMPNHMHGVIYVGEWDDRMNRGDGNDGARALDGTGEKAGGDKPLLYGKINDGTVREGLASSRNDAPSRKIATTPPTISAIIGAYKSLTYHDCLALAKENNEHLGKLWHRSFYEIIIRTPEAARRIRYYIRNNVRTWARDKFHEG